MSYSQRLHQQQSFHGVPNCLVVTSSVTLLVARIHMTMRFSLLLGQSEHSKVHQPANIMVNPITPTTLMTGSKKNTVS